MNNSQLRKQIKKWELDGKSSHFIISKIQTNFKSIIDDEIHSNVGISQKIYLFKNNLLDIPICKTCNKKPVSRYISFNFGYTKTCYDCSQKNKKNIKRKLVNRKIDTKIEKYIAKKTNRSFYKDGFNENNKNKKHKTYW
jgi:hypothetical protein